MHARATVPSLIQYIAAPMIAEPLNKTRSGYRVSSKKNTGRGGSTGLYAAIRVRGLFADREFSAMHTEGDSRNSSAPADTTKRRGRPPATGPESHRQRIERLQVELKEAQEALRATEEKRASIAGHAVLRHARHNTEFARQLAAALRAEIKSKADRATLADLMADTAPPPG